MPIYSCNTIAKEQFDVEAEPTDSVRIDYGAAACARVPPRVFDHAWRV